MRKFLIFSILFFMFLCGLSAQTTTSGNTAMTSTYFDMSGFPLWARDLRRAEIIAFGSFPFSYFISNFGFDTYRWANNSWDRRYAPWPIASSGNIEQTQSEKLMTLGIAAGGAILIAIVDHGIMRHKRKLLEQETEKYPEQAPIIIRRPLNGDEFVSSETSNDSAGRSSRSTE